LTRAYVTLVLAAAVANAAESYDVTNCGASTVTTVSATEELTVISVDTKGITRSNSPNKAFDNATYECASVVRIAGAQRSGLGYCKFMVPDGDSSSASRCLTQLVAENGSSCRARESGRVSRAAANLSR